MTADGRLPLEQRRNYKNVFNALARIVREEGVRALWTGCTPTIGRAMLVNMCQLASYSQAKQRLVATSYFNEGVSLHFCASMISGLITTAASMPVDIAKTRLQNMKVVDGKPQYGGTIDVLVKVVKQEGFFSLWRGFTPYYARLGPHTVLTFIILEQLNSLQGKVCPPSVIAKRSVSRRRGARAERLRAVSGPHVWRKLSAPQIRNVSLVSRFNSSPSTVHLVDQPQYSHESNINLGE